MNFVTDVVEKRKPSDLALVELARSGERREVTFAEVNEKSARFAGTLVEHGVRKGDVVLTLIGNRPEWVYAMVACFRIGAVALPCNEQLRSKDLHQRVEHAEPRLIVTDERNLEAVESLASQLPVLVVPDKTLFENDPVPVIDLEPTDPCLIIFTSGTSGEPKAVLHGQRYLAGQTLQSNAWFGARPGDLAWCTAASGWSKSARNVFVAPWLCGATALLHDGRFDPDERLEILERERVNTLCMAPTEYRVIAKRSDLRQLPHLHGLVAAGEALNPEVIEIWREAVGVEIRDGYGQTETGHLASPPQEEAIRYGSMGRLLPGIKGRLDDGELVIDPATVPTFFLNYVGEPPPAGEWRTGDRMRQDEDGFLYFEGRSDDLIISAGYRIGPFEVESALVSHPSVAEAAVISEPDEERGSVVKAVVVVRDGIEQSEALASELQNHVKRETAPYKYPRVIEFSDGLPKTTSGKIKRAELRNR